MLAKTIITCALATVGTAAVVQRTGGGGGGDHHTPEECYARTDGNTSPKYCPLLGAIGISVPIILCDITATTFLNVLSCCGESSCVTIDIL